MAAADFQLKAHDLLPSIQATLSADLTTATSVSFILKPVAGTTATKTPAVIVTPAAGVVRYDWVAGDTATPGDYLAEWEVLWPGGKKQTFPTLTYHSITILADLDGA